MTYCPTSYIVAMSHINKVHLNEKYDLNKDIVIVMQMFCLH